MMRQTRVQALKYSNVRPQSGLFLRLPVRTLKHAGRNGVPEEVRTSGGQMNRSGPASQAVGFHHDFAQVAVDSSKAPVDETYANSVQRFSAGAAGHLSPMAVQPKLKVGQPGDIYEQEAERVADHIMRLPEPGLQRKPT